MPGLRLPTNLDFEVWGLSDLFSGERSIGLWDVDGDDPPLRESARVYRVTTHHSDAAHGVSVSVCTVPNRRRSGGFGDYGFRDAAGSALTHATWKAAWCEPGIEASLDTLDVLRPGDDPQAPEWQRHRLVVAGHELEAHFLRVRAAWVAVANLSPATIAVSGCGVGPDTYGLVPIGDLGRYASQRWPRDRKRRTEDVR